MTRIEAMGLSGSDKVLELDETSEAEEEERDDRSCAPT